MTDYLIHAEDIKHNLSAAGEEVTESMFTSLLLKGLPPSYEYFKTFHTFDPTKV